ncbi:hypothetical protein Lal_00018919 [Lupinus albus]|nr:hypothetical protein Lal_00018919 [Lupinus albus]
MASQSVDHGSHISDDATRTSTDNQVVIHKCPIRGMTSMKKVICAISKNIKLPVEWNTIGQPLNATGGNTSVSYIGVMVKQNVAITFSFWTNVKLNIVKECENGTMEIGKDEGRCSSFAEQRSLRNLSDFGSSYVASFGSSDVASIGSSDVASFGSSDVASFGSSDVASFGSSDVASFGSSNVLEKNDTPSSAHIVDLNVLWVDARRNKNSVIDNEQVQEVVNRVVAVKEKEGELQTPDSHKGINTYKLYLDIPSKRVVGVGKVHKLLDVMLHNARPPPNHVKVATDVAIDDDALLSIPLDEDILRVGGAIGTFLAWQINLVHVVPNKYQSWGPRLSERFSLGRERFTWEGEILGYIGEFSPERELSRLGEKWHFGAVDTVRLSLEREG